MDKKLIELYKSGHMVIPLYLLKNYKDLKLDLDEFIFLMYLYNKGDKELFDPGKISNDLNIPLKDVMKYISTLTDKKMLKVDVVKNDKNRNLHRKKEKEEPVEEIFDYNWFEDDDSYEE